MTHVKQLFEFYKKHVRIISLNKITDRKCPGCIENIYARIDKEITTMCLLLAQEYVNFAENVQGMIEISDPDIDLIEEHILMAYNDPRTDYPHRDNLLDIRRTMINRKVLARQEEILPDIIAFNNAMRDALKNMYDRAHIAWDAVQGNEAFSGEVGLTAKCFLDQEYPELHPVQGDDRQDLWDALCDSGWNPLYEDGVTLTALTFPQDLHDSFDSLTGMDCPPPNWNEGLDYELTKDLHLISPFHHLFDHTKFAITDFIYARKFKTEINIEIDREI